MRRLPETNPPAADAGDGLAIGLIGFGAIGRGVAEAVAEGTAGRTRLCAVLCRTPEKHRGPWDAIAGGAPAPLFTSDIDGFLATGPGLVIEAAGQAALREHARTVLRSGANLLATSIGAFTDEALLPACLASAAAGGSRLMLASGALPAVDWMLSAAGAGPCSAEIVQSKPVASWRGTAAEARLDLDRLSGPGLIFEGSARDAARLFPRSSNITAMLALVGPGLDATRVTLIADPAARRMRTEIRFTSPAGTLRVEWEGMPSVLNPSTSADVPLNIIKSLRNLTLPLCFGP
jgi:aspartate dehydrogenase